MGKQGFLNVTESGSQVKHDPHFVQPALSAQKFNDKFEREFQFNVLEQPTPNELIVEMYPMDVSFANALRRILLAEIPTVAIEKVYIADNTSIIHDEVLAHRLGLVPIMADARMMDDYREFPGGMINDLGEEEEEAGANDQNTLVFRLDVKCTHAEAREAAAAQKRQERKNTESDTIDLVSEEDNIGDLEEVAQDAASRQPYKYPKDRPYTKNITSGDLEWIPQGDQEERLVDDDESDIGPIYNDILLAKLRPGQCIQLEAHAFRGKGSDHAKYSPVCTASYRLMPNVQILKDVYDDLAEELVHVYEPGVFELVPTTSKDPPGTRQKAKVKNPYACTMSRNFMRDETLAESIRITRISDHILFSIESVGQHPPEVLLAEALLALQMKTIRIMDKVDDRVKQGGRATSTPFGQNV